MKVNVTLVAVCVAGWASVTDEPETTDVTESPGRKVAGPRLALKPAVRRTGRLPKLNVAPVAAGRGMLESVIDVPETIEAMVVPAGCPGR